MAYQKNKSETYAVAGGINVKSSQYNTDQNEVLRLVNMNFKSVGAFTKRAGTTFYLGATVSGRVGGLYEFERLNGQSYIIAAANTNLYSVTNTNWNAVRAGLLNNGIFSFQSFVDRLFAANGQDFFKVTDSSTSSNFSLPSGVTVGLGITAAPVVGGGLSGIYVVGYGYLNDRGYYGPASAGVTVSLNGISYSSIAYGGLSVPSGYGISAIAFYRSAAGQVNMYGTTQMSASAGATFIDNAPISTRPAPEYINFTLAPQFLEIFNNQLMMAGVSSAPSTLYWSDIGEPEGIDPAFNAEVRTNDGDVIQGIRSYQNDLIIAKRKSLHRLSGSDPTNFTLQQITDQYGCLSHRTMITYNDQLVCLDEKGILSFNGANVQIMSDKIESIFERMNVSAAINNAVAIHYKKENQIWFHIPVDGSTINNLTIVFDYICNAFTTYEGFNASSIAVIKGAVSEKTVAYGGYTGTVAYFNENVESDLGQGITCLIQTRFVSNMGQSTEQQFRRFFLNIDPVVGVTQPISVNLKSNYGATNVQERVMYQAPFQSRIDFGIPAKTLSAEISHNSSTLSFKVFGFTIESRYQRSV